MSKVQEPNSWDARDAFHNATMTVYADLGALVEVLKRESDLRVTLLMFDEHVSPGAAPESGDPEFVADLKHAAGRLRASLATAQTIRDTDRRASRVAGHGGYFGGIRTVSHHDALLNAAEEALEPGAEGAARSRRTARPQSESGVIRRDVIMSAMDAKSWARLAENLEHEYRSASLLPLPSPDEPKSPVASLGQPHPSDGAAYSVGTETLQQLRAVLNVGVQVRYPQATRGLQELCAQLRTEDREALERAIAAEKAVKDAEGAVGANSNGFLRIDGPVFDALRNAGFASIKGNKVRYSGKKREREQIINAERAKLEAALQAARLVRDTAQRPEEAIRTAHKAMLPLLRERLARLRDHLQAHGPMFARPLGQDDPRYGPMEASHPPHFWSGPSAHDVLAQLVVDVLDTMDGNDAVGIVLADEEWERLRGHLVRESGELVRRAPSAVPGTLASPIPTPSRDDRRVGRDLGAPASAPAPANELITDKQIVGWAQVLVALGFDPKDRRGKELVRRRNAAAQGPIIRMKNSVTAPRGNLVGWWRKQVELASDTTTDRELADRRAAAARSNMANPGVRKDEGFHLKDTPNKRRAKPS